MKDTKVEQEVKPAVEHETVVKEHETQEKEVIDRERHQHHYHTTVQPLTDSEVRPEEHTHTQEATEYRQVNKDHEGAQAKAAAEREAAAAAGGLKDTSVEGQTREHGVQKETVVGEQVHHHLHEIVQPVIEKETVVPQVTHVTKPVKEVIQEESKNHGVTKKEAISVDEFQHKLDGEGKREKVVEGGPDVVKASKVSET